MAVDYDDLISNRLAQFVSINPDEPGWFFNDGYLYSPGSELRLYQPNFFQFCGTSHIIRAPLLKIPRSIDELDEAHTARWFGSHIFIKQDLDKTNSPLSPLPFVGSIYRVGHDDATSRSASVNSISKPTDKRFPITPEILTEFFGGVAE